MEKWVSGTPGVWNSGVIPPRRKAEGPRGDGITHSGLTPSGTWGSRHQEPGGSRHQKPGAYATGLYDVAPLGAGGGSWSAAFVVPPLVGIPLFGGDGGNGKRPWHDSDFRSRGFSRSDRFNFSG